MPYCAATYLTAKSRTRFICVSQTHDNHPDRHHFVEVNTTPMSTAAEAQRRRDTPRYLRPVT